MPLMPEQELRRDLLLFSLSKWPDIDTAMKMAARMEQFVLRGNVAAPSAGPDIAAEDAPGGQRPCEQVRPETNGDVQAVGSGESAGQSASSGMACGQKRRWSAEDDENLERFWHSDRPLEDIAEEMGRTVPSLYCRARALGFSKRGGKPASGEPGQPSPEGPQRPKPAPHVVLERFGRQRQDPPKERGGSRSGRDRDREAPRITPSVSRPPADDESDISIDRIIHFLRCRDYSVTRVEDGRYRLDGRRVLSASELREKANQVRVAIGQPPFTPQPAETVG